MLCTSAYGTCHLHSATPLLQQGCAWLRSPCRAWLAMPRLINESLFATPGDFFPTARSQSGQRRGGQGPTVQDHVPGSRSFASPLCVLCCQTRQHECILCRRASIVASVRRCSRLCAMQAMQCASTKGRGVTEHGTTLHMQRCSLSASSDSF